MQISETFRTCEPSATTKFRMENFTYKRVLWTKLARSSLYQMGIWPTKFDWWCGSIASLPSHIGFVCKVPDYCSLMTTLFCCLFVPQDCDMKHVHHRSMGTPPVDQHYIFWHGGSAKSPTTCFDIQWYLIPSVSHPYFGWWYCIPISCPIWRDRLGWFMATWHNSYRGKIWTTVPW